MPSSRSAKSGIAALFRQFAVLGSGAVLTQGLNLLTTIVLARHLAPQAYGTFVATYATAGLTAVLFNWGLDSWLLRKGAAHPAPAQLAGSLLAIKVELGLAWAVAVTIALPALKPDVFLLPVAALGALDVWCDSLLNIQLTSLNLARRAGAMSALSILSRGLRLAGTLALIAAGVQGVAPFVAARLAATLAVLAIALRLARPVVRRDPPAVQAAIVRQSASFALADLLSLIYLQVDVALLTFLLGDARAVGLYGTASGVVGALFVIPNAAYLVALPALVRLLNGQDRGRFWRAAAATMLASAGLGAVLWLSAFAGGGAAVALLLGENYAESGQLLAALSPILLFKSISFGAAAVLVAADWQRYRVVVQAAATAANIGLNLLVIPRWGAWGSAWVYVASEAMLACGYVWLALRWRRAARRGASGFPHAPAPQPAAKETAGHA
jgi:O-antigen/teichoic acid export membrane protein